MLYIRLLTIIIFLYSVSCKGQNPFYYKIDQSKGLPSNSVYDIFQDHKGFMWFATNKGLCKYDGKYFLTYTNDNQTSISGSSIQEDAYGRIWYSNFDGYLYYVENNQLKSLHNTSTIGFVKFGITAKHLIVLQKNYIVFYDLKNLNIYKKVAFNTQKLFATHFSNSTFYLLGDSFTVVEPNLSIQIFPIPKEVYKNYPAPILQESMNGLLLVSKYADYFFEIKKNKFYKRKITGNFTFIQNLAFDKTFNWICTTQGAIKSLNGSINTRNTYLKDFNISYVFKDKEENYWFSTLDKGLLLVPNLHNNFVSFDKKPLTISTNDESIFIGSADDKLYKGDLCLKNFERIFDGRSNHEIYFLSSDLQHLFFTSNTFKKINLKNQLKEENIIALKDAQKLNEKYYVFAASGVCGLLKNATSKNEWDFWTKNDTQTIIPIINGVQGKSATYNPFNNTIYYATNNGLFAVVKDKIFEIKLKKEKLFFSKIKNIGDKIYAITSTEKLYIITSDNHITQVSIQQYINNESINKIKFLNSTLYIITSFSLYSFNLRTHHIEKIISISPEHEISDLIELNNNIIGVTSKGFLSIPKKNKRKNFPAKLILNSALVNGKLIDLDNLGHLHYTENTINLNYSILSYIPNQKNKLYYSIDDSSWILTDEDARNLLLNSLSSGKHSLKFQTVANGKKSVITKLTLNISKPFWLSYSFISLVILFFIGLIYSFLKWQLAKIKKRNQLLLDKIHLEKNVNQSNLRALKSQMNPHFFFNALNTLQSYIIANEKNEAIEYLSKFSNLTRIILEMTDKDWINISDEIKTLRLYLEIEKARFEDDFLFSIKTQSDLDIDTIKIPSMLLQPYVENALKHGLLHKIGTKELHLNFTIQNKVLNISIEDNGIGRKKSQELNEIKNKKHQSFATNALQNRIDLLNEYNQKNISIEIIDKLTENQLPNGTLVIIQIPL
ncbi:Sensor histidine kinase YehU [Flavobacterium columnare]|uniref:Histidine kinase n=2 Tax=Flavobacterium TaxID=237 RepID=A0ABW8PNX7_9FLAO|nr:histidine kinase [Flavobacterium columnare]SPE77876.1 Sensor histidine kinase YehU [Flavobacterium columnare]